MLVQGVNHPSEHKKNISCLYFSVSMFQSIWTPGKISQWGLAICDIELTLSQSTVSAKLSGMAVPLQHSVFAKMMLILTCLGSEYNKKMAWINLCILQSLSLFLLFFSSHLYLKSNNSCLIFCCLIVYWFIGNKNKILDILGISSECVRVTPYYGPFSGIPLNF